MRPEPSWVEGRMFTGAWAGGAGGGHRGVLGSLWKVQALKRDLICTGLF